MGLFDLSASYKITKPITINGGKGTVVITPSGGTAPYQIIGLGSNQKYTVLLEAGQHVYEIIDSKQKKYTLSFTLTEPDEFKLDFSPDNSSVVKIRGKNTFKTHGARAKITINAKGGTAPYKYNNGSKNVFELLAGTHTISVKDKYNNEEKIVIDLAQPDVFEVTPELTNLGNKIKGKDAVKKKGGKANVKLKASGGHAPYTYNGNAIDNLDLPAGTHNIKVTDQYGNEKTIQIILAEPEEFVVTKSFIDLADEKIDNHPAVKKNGGTAKVKFTAKGGFSPYTYDGASDNEIELVAVEKRKILVKDNVGNEQEFEITLKEPKALTIKPPSCGNTIATDKINGKDALKSIGAKATVTIEVEGGFSPYTFSEGDKKNKENAAKKHDFNVGVGNHTFKVIDKYGSEESVTINLTEPPILECTSVIDPNALVTDAADKIKGKDTLKENAKKAEVTFTASGGHGDYKYNNQDNNKIMLGAGTHDIIVKDKYENKKTIQIILAEPEKLVVTPTYTDLADEKIDSHPAVKKNGEKAKVKFTAKGGFSPYKYNGTTNNEIELGEGKHEISVKDKYGLEKKLEIIIKQPKALKIKHSFGDTIAADKINGKDALKSNGAKATVKIEVEEGGFAPYSFYEGEVKAKSLPTVKIHDFIVGAGKHEFKVKDKYGDEKSVTIDLAEPEKLECDIEIKSNDLVEEIDKIGGFPTLREIGGKAKVTLTPKGGHKPYEFDGSDKGDSLEFDQIAKKGKKIKVTDKCGNEVIVEINIAQAEPLTVTHKLKNPYQINGVDAVAEYGGEAEVSFDVKGGFPKFKAKLNGIDKDSPDRSFDDSFKVGKHKVTVKDKYDNTSEVEFELAEPDKFWISYNVLEEVKVPGGKAKIQINFDGGIAPYTGHKKATDYFRDAGEHEFVVTDNNGAQAKIKITIEEAKQVILKKKIIGKNVTNTPGKVGKCDFTKQAGQPTTTALRQPICNLANNKAVLTFKHKMLNKKSGDTSSATGKGVAFMQTKYDKATVQGGTNTNKVAALKTKNVYKELEKNYDIVILPASPKTYIFQITAGKYTHITDHLDSLVHFKLEAEGPSCDFHKASGGRVFEIADNGVDRRIGREPRSTDEENRICITKIEESTETIFKGMLRSPFSVDFFGEKDAEGKKVGIRAILKKFWDDISLNHSPAKVSLSLNKCDMAETKVIFEIFPAIKWQIKGTYDFGNGERYSSVDAETKDVGTNIAGSTSGISLIRTYGTYEKEYAFNAEDWFFSSGGEASYLDSLMTWCLQISNGIKGFVVFPKVELTGEWGWDWNQDPKPIPVGFSANPPTIPPIDTYTVTKVKKYGKFIANFDPLFGLKFRINLLKVGPGGWVLEVLSWVKKITAGYVTIDFGIDIYADSIVSLNFEVHVLQRDADEWSWQFDFSLLKIVVGICAYAKTKLNFIIIKISGAVSADLATGLAFGCPPKDQRQTKAWIDIDFLGVKGTLLLSGEIGVGMFKNTDRPDKSQTIDGYTDNAKGDNDENLDGKRGGLNRKARKKKEVLFIQPFHIVRWQMMN